MIYNYDFKFEKVIIINSLTYKMIFLVFSLQIIMQGSKKPALLT